MISIDSERTAHIRNEAVFSIAGKNGVDHCQLTIAVHGRQFFRVIDYGSGGPEDLQYCGGTVTHYEWHGQFSRAFGPAVYRAGLMLEIGELFPLVGTVGIVEQESDPLDRAITAATFVGGGIVAAAPQGVVSFLAECGVSALPLPIEAICQELSRRIFKL